ncbi:MAG: XTP/dITP diphosphatase [Candidatus Methanospirareceae archaeon]
MEREVIFITSNKNKVKEVERLASLEDVDIKIEHLDYRYEELQHEEIEEVVRYSAELIRKELKLEKPFVIEDSGLFINALNGFPGPFSAYVFKKIGNSGILKLMEGKEGEERDAIFKSAVAFCYGKNSPVIFVGSTRGRIAKEERGSGGFGYDPIFEVKGRTFAEMSIEEKNEVSHRGRAFKKFILYFKRLRENG